MSVGGVDEAETCQVVSNLIIFPVDVADIPLATGPGERLTQVVTFSQQDAQVGAMAAPTPLHHHNNEQRV